MVKRVPVQFTGDDLNRYKALGKSMPFPAKARELMWDFLDDHETKKLGKVQEQVT